MTGTLKDLSRVSLDEIIFEGRNQEYGAFQLRRLYDQHLRQAVVIATLLCLLIVATPYLQRLLGRETLLPKPPRPEAQVEYEFKELPPLEQIAKPVAPTPPPAQQVVNQTQHVPPRVVQDHEQDQKLTTVAEALAANQLGTTTVTNGVDAVPLPAVIDVPAAPAAEAPEEVIVWAEEMPVFPGGQGELLKYIAKHTSYPALALRNHIEGRVYVKFVVDEQGFVRNPVVTKGIGGGCDEEAVRVVQTLPRFTPGRQNGRPVKVFYSVPINFTIR